MPDETTTSTATADTSTATVDTSTVADATTTASDASQAQDSTTSHQHDVKDVNVATGSPKKHVTKSPTTGKDSSLPVGRQGKRPRGSASSSSGGPEETKVNTEKLRATADKGKQTIKTLKETLADVATSVRATEANGIWIGKAADDYREHFLHVLETFNKQLDLFAAYPRDLIAYADEQDQVITETNRLAQSLLEEVESANWPQDL